MNTREVQEALKKIGWPIDADGSFGGSTFNAVQDFQRGFGWWHLKADGFSGPKTHRALKFCVRHEGRCSQHFRFRDFASRGNGWIKVHRALVRGLEDLRDDLDNPIVIQSGYRDPRHNVTVGGARASQHLYGNAADIEPNAPLRLTKRLRRFSGIGIRRSDNSVAHVDVRHKGPNLTGGTPEDPTIWFYG